MLYRPDIDGLRAFAVLSVIIFHFFPEILTGGFVGVDIFFVISGYLITSIIFKELDADIFSFKNFYARRIKRIFPSLITVIISIFVIGWFLFIPPDYAQLGKHIMSGTAFISNIILWQEVGYFDSSIQSKPLLHLWSLSVEEQFYILWPFLLWMAWKRKINLLLVVISVFIASFVLNIVIVQNDKMAAFYLPHARFWELLAGSILAWLHRHPSQIQKNIEKQANALSLLSIIILITSVIFINENMLSYGIWAIFPVFGTAIIISTGNKSHSVKLLLSNHVMRWLGLISYPLYLWHWVFLSAAFNAQISNIQAKIFLIFLSVFAAFLTYEVIEKPLRFSKKKHITLYLCLSMATLFALGCHVYTNKGYPSRFPENLRSIVNYSFDNEKAYREKTCFLDEFQTFSDFKNCPTPLPLKQKSLVLWGDSIAAHLYPGYLKNFGQQYNIIQRTASRCPPILKTAFPNRPHCKAINDEMLKYLSLNAPDKLILSAFWADYDTTSLEFTIKKLKEIGIKEIEIVGFTPQWNTPLQKNLYLYYKKFGEIPYRSNFSLTHYTYPYDKYMTQRIAKIGIRYISLVKILCNQEGCLNRLKDENDSLIVWDGLHLTDKGSEYVVSMFPKE